MTYEFSGDATESKQRIECAKTLPREQQAILDELVEVLSAHPRGLRRWSVMRAIRASRSKRGREIPHKFEDEVERSFRRHCVDGAESGSVPPGEALFYRPKETAGEVWAVCPARASQ